MSKDTNYKGLFMLAVIVIAAIAGYMASKQYFNGENNGNNNNKHKFESLLVYPNQKTFSGLP